LLTPAGVFLKRAPYSVGLDRVDGVDGLLALLKSSASYLGVVVFVEVNISEFPKNRKFFCLLLLF